MKKIRLSESKLINLIHKVVNEGETRLLNERPCGGNPLKFNLGGGWDVQFDIDPGVSVWPLQVNLGAGSYSCKFTFTFRRGPSSGPPINDADEIYDVAIQNGYSPENAEGMVEVARKKMRQIGRRRDDGQIMDRIRARALNESDLRRLINRVVNEGGTKPTNTTTPPNRPNLGMAEPPKGSNTPPHYPDVPSRGSKYNTPKNMEACLNAGISRSVCKEGLETGKDPQPAGKILGFFCCIFHQKGSCCRKWAWRNGVADEYGW